MEKEEQERLAEREARIAKVLEVGKTEKEKERKVAYARRCRVWIARSRDKNAPRLRGSCPCGGGGT